MGEIFSKPVVIKKILYVAFGNHPRSRKEMSLAEKFLLLLKEEGPCSLSKIFEHLELNPMSKIDKARFYRIFNPLKGGNALSVQFVSCERRCSNRKEYYLTTDGFTKEWDSMRKNVKVFLQSQE